MPLDGKRISQRSTRLLIHSASGLYNSHIKGSDSTAFGGRGHLLIGEILDILEIFYHIVAILACRAGDAVAPCKPLANHVQAIGADSKTLKQTGLDVLSSAAEAYANTNQQRRLSTSIMIDATYDPTVANGEAHETNLEPGLNQQISNF